MIIWRLSCQLKIDRRHDRKHNEYQVFSAASVRKWSKFGLETAERQKDRLSVRLILVPKVSLAPLLEALDHVGIRPSRAEIADGPDVGSCLSFDGEGGREHRTSSRLVRAAAFCCATLALAAITTPFLRQQMVLAALDRDIAIGRAAAA
jgi:hypothetical protein